MTTRLGKGRIIRQICRASALLVALLLAGLTAQPVSATLLNLQLKPLPDTYSDLVLVKGNFDSAVAINSAGFSGFQISPVSLGQSFENIGNGSADTGAPLPEPATISLVLLALGCGLFVIRRFERRNSRDVA